MEPGYEGCHPLCIYDDNDDYDENDEKDDNDDNDDYDYNDNCADYDYCDGRIEPGYERCHPLHRLGRGHPHRLTQCDHLKGISAAKKMQKIHSAQIKLCSSSRKYISKKYHSHVL